MADSYMFARASFEPALVSVGRWTVVCDISITLGRFPVRLDS